MKSPKLELYSMLQKGFELKTKHRLEEQKKNPGADWRGGNSGCITEDGTILGESPRRAVLRHLGIEFPTTLDDDLIFEAGFKNEDHWTELLTWAGVNFKQEEEIPVSWKLPNNETIGGRPDIVIGHDEETFKPKFGVELKLISSNGKMLRHSHFGKANPIPYMVCQSGHYSHQMGLPWVLAYTSRTHFAAFYWGAKHWKHNQVEGAVPHRSLIVDDKTGKVMNVKPFISLYDINWNGNTLTLDGEDTIITSDGIQRFYQYCSDCVKYKRIPKHNDNIDVWGNKEEKSNPNVIYDNFAEASETEGFDEWITQCRDIVESNSN